MTTALLLSTPNSSTNSLVDLEYPDGQPHHQSPTTARRAMVIEVQLPITGTTFINALENGFLNTFLVAIARYGFEKIFVPILSLEYSIYGVYLSFSFRHYQRHVRVHRSTDVLMWIDDPNVDNDIFLFTTRIQRCQA